MDERNIFAVLARIDGIGAELDPRPVRAELLTSRETALVLGAGVLDAARSVGNSHAVRSAVADMALAWRNVIVPASPMPPPVHALAGVVRGMRFVASDKSIGAALRWLVETDHFWPRDSSCSRARRHS